MDRHRRASEIFLQVSNLPPDERAAYLDEACRDDAALRAYVEKLLAHDHDDSFLEPLDAKLESRNLPERIGDFRILRKIGSGGMGTVYEAEQVSLQRPVALKVLPSHLSFSDEAVSKFHREAEAGGRQSHPDIVAIHAVGEHEGFHYIAQELVKDGITLNDQLEELRETGEQPPGYFRKVAKLVSRIADALQHAHDSGVVHRDVKPSNILLAGEWNPKVTDFGLARIEDALALSRTGDLAGTPYYMSPEQAMSRRAGIDKRTDIYSLGVTLYEMLTLKRPFEGATSHEILKKIVVVDPVDPHKANPKVPRDISVICSKAMEKLPANRYQSMEKFSKDLTRYVKGDAILARPVGLGIRLWKRVRRNPVVSTAVGVAILAVFGFVLYLLLWSYPRIRYEKKVAESEKERALAAEKSAKEQYRQITRLSDIRRLADLEKEAEELWPAHPDNIVRLNDWLVRAGVLFGRLVTHRKTLDALKKMALPRDEAAIQKDRDNHPSWPKLLDARKAREIIVARLAGIEAGDAGGASAEEAEVLTKRLADLDRRITRLEIVIKHYRVWEFADMETLWQHDLLEELVRGIVRMVDVEGGWGVIRDIEERLEFASTVEERSITSRQVEWDRAVASIASKEECPQYNGLRIKEQIGFVPIGRDPDSGLWEFVHIQSGEIPERDEDWKLILFEEMGIVFVLIPGGEFQMGAVPPTEENPPGSPNVDPQARTDEAPVHKVALKPFFMSKFEMAQSQWYMGDNPSFYHAGGKLGGVAVDFLHPAESVSWFDCQTMLRRLNLRLPSEAEWEYAARAGTATVYWTGDEKQTLEGAVNLCDLFCKRNGGPATWTYEEWLYDGHTVHAPVGGFNPNAFGLHEVCGNISEWCQDSYIDNYEAMPTDGSAFESPGCQHRVYRGGNWRNHAHLCRSACRSGALPNSRGDYLGLRPAYTLRVE